MRCADAIRAGNLIDAETMVSSEETIGTLEAAGAEPALPLARD
jgi:hypothetical protein